MVPLAGTAATIGKIAKKAKKAIDKAQDKKGVYDLIVKHADDLDQAYVGQSKDIYKRMHKHFGKRGKLKTSQDVLAGVTHKMPGSTKLEREIYEQFIILQKYGGDISPRNSSRFHQLLNKVNPVGGRFNLKTDVGIEEFTQKATEIAKKYNLPTKFKQVILN